MLPDNRSGRNGTRKWDPASQLVRIKDKRRLHLGSISKLMKLATNRDGRQNYIRKTEDHDKVIEGRNRNK